MSSEANITRESLKRSENYILATANQHSGTGPLMVTPLKKYRLISWSTCYNQKSNTRDRTVIERCVDLTPNRRRTNRCTLSINPIEKVSPLTDGQTPDNNAMNRSRFRPAFGWSREHFAQGLYSTSLRLLVIHVESSTRLSLSLCRLAHADSNVASTSRVFLHLPSVQA